MILKMLILRNESLPANVHLVRQKSAWNNAELCTAILKVLKDALAPHLSALHPVLLLDAAKIHVSWITLGACFRMGLWPLPTRVRRQAGKTCRKAGDNGVATSVYAPPEKS